MSRTLLLTGGTGFIGSHLAARLLQDGHFVYFLARADRRLSAEGRILSALAPLVTPRQDQYRILERELTVPLEMNTREIDEVWHCAASLSFKETDRRKTFAANVGGTRNLLGFMERHGIRRLHHVSTAYVVGDRGGPAWENELDWGQRFHNPYEESKMKAEQEVRHWSETTGGRATVYRPSIIVGNSQTGFAPKCAGYYTCARYFFAMKQILAADLQSNPGSYENSGIQKCGDILHLPVCFPGMASTLVNILPIDLAVEAILQCSKAIGTFHITNSMAVRLDRLVEMTMLSMGISGVTVGNLGSATHPLIFQINEQIKHAVKYFHPYASYGADSPIFNQTHTTRILGRPLEFEITEPFLRFILNSASRAMPSMRPKSPGGKARFQRLSMA